MKVTTQLKPFQKETVSWLKNQEQDYDGGLLLNDAGLGKSICLLANIINNPLKTLIICPAGLIDNWVNEIKKHTDISRLCVMKYYGNKRQEIQIKKEQIIFITSYSLVSREFNGSCFEKGSLFNKIRFQRIILDEAHYIRNSNSSVHKGIIYLGESYSVNIKKWVVTATPIFNEPNDMFAYFKFLSLEGIDSRREWTERVTKSLDGFHTLNTWIEKYGLSMKKHDVLDELKMKNEMKCKLKFTDIEKEFYEALKEYSHARMKTLVNRIERLNRKVFDDVDGSMRKILHSNVMVYILRLKQACNSPWLIFQCMKRLQGAANMKEAVEKLKFYNQSKTIEEECPICYDTIADYIAEPCGHKCCQGCWNRMFNAGIVNCPKCREYVENISAVKEEKRVKDVTLNIDEVSSSKINEIMKITKKVIQKNEKIVIVSQWVSMLNLIRKVFEQKMKDVKFVSLQGDMPLKNRTQVINQFETSNDIRVCFVSLMSSAEGINLVSSNHLILVDTWWNNAKMSQVMDRIHRIGQKKDVNIYKFQIENSIEEQIEQLVNKKHKMANLILSKWCIQDKKNYDDSWLKDIIKLIEKPNEEVN
jgi:SNF2 family DNA or RNA helicase